MNHKEQLSKIKAIFGIQVALESMKLDNGVEIEAEVFETGKMFLSYKTVRKSQCQSVNMH